MSDSKNTCYECKWRRDVVGSTHSQCRHPVLEPAFADPLVELIAITGAPFYLSKIAAAFGFYGHPHGVVNGWFAWPWNYDPTWVRGECGAFEPIVEDNDDKE